MYNTNSGLLQCQPHSRLEIHTFIEPSTGTWQYIVIAPLGEHCVIVDPVLQDADSQNRLCTTSADDILDFVKQHRLQVDSILETCSRPSSIRSAAWYLRMQLLLSQGYAPRVCGSRATAPFDRLFSRKYGRRFQNTLENDYVDGEAMTVGGMNISIMSLPGVSSPDGRAYLVEDNVFGAQSAVELQSELEEARTEIFYDWDSSDRYRRAWASMQKILALPGHTRIWPSSGKTAEVDGIVSEKAIRPFSTVREFVLEAPVVHELEGDNMALLDEKICPC